MKTETTITPVILSGGSGTRLWPLSRDSYPKQFLDLLSEQSLFEATVKRARSFTDKPLIVVCNEQHRFLVAEQLREMGEEHARIILEPEGRNTAPAAAIATLHNIEVEGNGDSLILLMPSDHLISDEKGFHGAIEAGASAAHDGEIVTFGIIPTHPETGYGYLRAKTDTPDYQTNTVLPLAQFVEKPNLETAIEYLAAKSYLWNSGIFLFRADRYLEELQRFQPDMFEICQQSMQDSSHDHDFVRPDKTLFSQCPSNSIDYAVMEKTAKAAVVPIDVGWNDVGSWSSLWDVSEKDADGNFSRGDVLTHETENCLIHADHKLVATLGLKDIVVVETADAVLIADKAKVQDVKTLVSSLNGSKRYESNMHRKVYRPWGHYDSIDNGDRFQVKRITVNPGEKLSLQKHLHRAEHWVVVTGTAEITCGDKTFLLTENQSTYIPTDTLHRLTNPGKIPLEIIEIQSGSYLGEDDIIRVEDNYGRDDEDSNNLRRIV